MYYITWNYCYYVHVIHIHLFYVTLLLLTWTLHMLYGCKLLLVSGFNECAASCFRTIIFQPIENLDFMCFYSQPWTELLDINCKINQWQWVWITGSHALNDPYISSSIQQSFMETTVVRNTLSILTYLHDERKHNVHNSWLPTAINKLHFKKSYSVVDTVYLFS